MKTLKNINKSIKVDVMDTLKLHRFLKENVKWDFDYFRNYLNEVDRADKKSVCIRVNPKFLLLPNYHYSSIPYELRRAANIKEDKWYNEIIKLENFSLYNVFEVEKAEDVKGSRVKDVWLWVEIDSYESENRTMITELGLVMEYNYSNNNYTSIGVHLSYWDDDIKELEDSLKTLKWANNRSYHRFVTKKKGGVAEKIEVIEDELWIMLNFFYIVYTGGYERDRFSKILEPITDMLRNYGDTFEEVIEAMKMAVTLI
jgi:hypothetical protein